MIDGNLFVEKANNIKNVITIGMPKYKSVNSIYLPKVFFILFILQINIQLIKSSPNVKYRECPRDTPIQKLTTGECVLEYCTPQQYANLECNVTNPVIKKQWIN